MLICVIKFLKYSDYTCYILIIVIHYIGPQVLLLSLRLFEVPKSK